MRWLDGVTEISGHDSEQTPGDSEREGSLVCCSSWSCRVENNSETENNNKGTRNSAAELSKGKCNKKKVKGLKDHQIIQALGTWSYHFMSNTQGKVEKVTDILFLDSKITVDGDCSYEIQRRLLLGRKAMTNLDGILKSRAITLLTKVHIVKAIVFKQSCTNLRARPSRRLSTEKN